MAKSSTICAKMLNGLEGHMVLSLTKACNHP